MLRVRLATFVAVLLALAPLPARAQDGVGFPTLQIERVDSPEPGKLRLFVTELDPRGNVPTDPPAADGVMLKVDGEPRTLPGLRVEPFERANEPLTVVLVVQLSGAIGELFPEVKSSLLRFAKGLGTATSIGLVAYAGGKIVSAVAPTPPASFVPQLEALRNTDDPEQQFGAAMDKVVEQLRASSAGAARRVVVVVSDGLWNDADLQLAPNAGRRAQELGARVHVLALKPVPTDDGVNRMRRLATGSKGTLRVADSGAVVQAQLDAISAQLRLQHVLEVELPQLFDGKDHDLAIRLRDGGTESESTTVNPGKHWISSWSTLKPLVFAGVALLVIGAIAGLVLWQRRKVAQALLQAGSAPSPRPQPEVERGPATPPPNPARPPRPVPVPEPSPTMLGMEVNGSDDGRSRVRDVDAGPLPGREPSVVAPRLPNLSAFGERPSIARPQPSQPEHPTVPPLPELDSQLPMVSPVEPERRGMARGRRATDRPSIGADLGQAGLSSEDTGQNELNGLPSPTQFLERAMMGQLPDVAGSDIVTPAALGDPASIPGLGVVPKILDESTPSENSAEHTAPLDEEGAPTLAIARPDFAALRRGVPEAQVIEHGARSIGAGGTPGRPLPPVGGGPRGAARPSGPGVSPSDSMVSRPSIQGIASLAGAGRKTQIVDPSELRSPDTSAWVTYLDGAGETERLQPGERVADRVFDVGPDGRWLAGGRVLEDGETLVLGDRVAVFASASKFPIDRTPSGPALRVLGGLDDGRSVEIGPSALVIGTDPSAGLVVRGAGVERRHVVVRLTDAGLEVVDLGTTSGFRVGRETLRQARLDVGGELFVGAVRLKYQHPR